MTVAFVQKTAQQLFSGVSTASRTITGVTAHNTVAALVTFASQPNPTNPAALPIPTGWTVAENPIGPGPDTSPYRPVNAIYFKADAASGSHTIDFSGAAALPTDSYGAITLIEFSGCDTTSPLDTHGTTSAMTGTSGSTSAVTNSIADAVALVIGHPDSNGVSSLSFPPSSGYTDLDHSTNNSADAAYDFGYKILSATGSQQASWTWTGDAPFQGTIVILKGASAPSTFDRAESSAGTTAQERGIAAGVDRTESSAGTSAGDRTISLSTSAGESSAGTEAEDRSIALSRDRAESSAGTEAEDRSVSLSSAASESSAGTTAQERSVPVSGDVSESSAGTTAQDFSAGSTNPAAESSAGTTGQDRGVTLSAGSTESSAGTTSQDFTAGSTSSASESSAPDTTQDRAVNTGSWAVNESSSGSTSQTIPPPAGMSQSAMRRWLIQQYTQEFEARQKAKKVEEAPPAEAKRRPVLKLKKVSEPDYEDRLSKAISMAQSLMVDHGADVAKVYAIIAETEATKSLVAKANAALTSAAEIEANTNQRKFEQAGWSEDDLILLAHIL